MTFGTRVALEEIREAFSSQDELADIPVALQAKFFKPTPNAARLPVPTHIDLKQIRFRKD
jgi:hypothetical protein